MSGDERRLHAEATQAVNACVELQRAAHRVSAELDELTLPRPVLDLSGDDDSLVIAIETAQRSVAADRPR